MTTKPKALRPGDLIGLIAPSGSVREAAQVDKAVAALARLGFRVREGASCRATYGYLAGSDEGRATDVNAFFADPAICGIVCMKGGYGTPRILDLLDYRTIAANPKVLVGYSDITGIHLAVNRLARLATFHGPMGISDVLLEGEEYSTGSWMRALSSTGSLGRLEPPAGAPPPRVLVPGRARGELIGGNLSLVAALMGTPFELDARGKILFFEDIDERPYRVDRMLTQLRLAGKFDECAGVALGDWKSCDPEEGKPSLSLEEVFRDVIAPAGKPVIMGLRAGHCSPTMSFPFGVEADLDAESERPGLEMVEAALVE
jgi:muramoyltetrapeptide carboxypeptidase